MNSFTPNYNFDLYDTDDKPNLCDQYNDAMGKIDNQFKVSEGNVQIAITNANNATAAIDTVKGLVTDEQTRAESAEKDIQDNLDTLQTNTANDVQTLTTSISDLTETVDSNHGDVLDSITSIQGNVKTNSTAITSVQNNLNAKFPVVTSNIADGAITAAKLNASALNSILEGFTIRYFDSSDSAADNEGMTTGPNCNWAGFYITGLNLLVVEYMEIQARSGGITNIFNDPTYFILPTYVPRPTQRILVASCNGMLVDGGNRSFQGIRISPNGAIGFNTGTTSASGAMYTTGPVIAWMGAYGTTYSASGNSYTNAVTNNGAL